MSHFTLIHGSWHGAWCWYKVMPCLLEEGHQVIAPDLLGRKRGDGATCYIGLKRIAQQVARQIPKNAKTTIVAHSRYGILASTLAQLYPNRIDRVIYLAAYMLPNKSRAIDYFNLDADSYLTPFIKRHYLSLTDSLLPEIYREGLYHDCKSNDVMLGHALLTNEPSLPAISKLKLTEDRYGRVPKAYIRLTEDRAVSIKFQDFLLNKTKVDRVESIRASHSAYFSRPRELSQLIIKLTK